MYVAGNSVARARVAALAAAHACFTCGGPTESPIAPDAPTIISNELAPKGQASKTRDTKSPYKWIRARAKRKVEKAQKRAQRRF